MSAMKVIVWSTPNCVQCMMTKREMDKLGIVYEAADLTDPANEAQLEAFKSQGLIQAPIVTTDIKVWSGFQPGKIRSLASYLMGERNG
jgi:glutaredoxin-like protein NrdH